MKEVDWPFIATQKKLTQNTLTKTEEGETVEIEFNKDYPFVFDIPNDCVSIEKLFIGELNAVQRLHVGQNLTQFLHVTSFSFLISSNFSFT